MSCSKLCKLLQTWDGLSKLQPHAVQVQQYYGQSLITIGCELTNAYAKQQKQEQLS